MKNGMMECSVCHSKLVSPTSRSVSRAYDRHKSRVSKKQRALNFLLVVGDCMLVGLQPILVYMSKVDGRFLFSPISVNFLTECTKVVFAVVMLLIQARNQKVGEKPLLSRSTFVQNLFLYGYGAIFNFLAILVTAIIKGPRRFDILQGHSKATMFLMCNNAVQGILSSFFFKYADIILKNNSSTVATIFTEIASAVLFGHPLTMNFVLGISIVFISMHQFFSPLSKAKDEESSGNLEMTDSQDNQRSKETFINMAAGANEEVQNSNFSFIYLQALVAPSNQEVLE